jgi:hypothetical protein
MQPSSSRTTRVDLLGQPFRASLLASSSATQAPLRTSSSGSMAGVHADAAIFKAAWWMASVVVIPTEYDSHRPRADSQSTNSWVPPPESQRARTHSHRPPAKRGVLGPQRQVVSDSGNKVTGFQRVHTQ